MKTCNGNCAVDVYAEIAGATAGASGYTAHGAVARMVYGNGVVETNGYNSLLQWETQSVVRSGGVNFGLTLGYGSVAGKNNGNVMSQRIVSGSLDVTQAYTYTQRNQLASAAETMTLGGAANWSRSFDYDLYGNQWMVAASPVDTTPYVPVTSAWFDGANNRLKPTNPSDIDHSAAGEMTRLGGWTYAYSAEGQMKTATLNVAARDYVYDGANRRVKVVAGGVATFYVYGADGELVAEYGGTGVGPTGRTYVTADWLGSTRLVTDGGGNAVSRRDYFPFGQAIDGSVGGRGSLYGAGLGTAMMFTSKERDGETGLDYFEARYLSSAQGRFTSTDPKSGWPSDPQSWNMYAYGRNNPLLYTDPDGQTYRICQVGSDGKDANCTEQQNELTDNQFNQFQKDSKGKMAFSGGKIFAINDNGSRTQTGTYKQTDVDLNDAGQELFQGNRQLWNNSATVVNAAAIGTGAMMALPVAAEVAALPSLQVAVGQSFNQWHVAFRATGGPWLHGMGLGAESGVTVTEAGAARFAGKALFNFSLKILRPGPVNAMGAGGGAAAGSCLRAACTAFLKGWGLK